MKKTYNCDTCKRQLEDIVVWVFRQQSDILRVRWNEDRRTDKEQNLDNQTELYFNMAIRSYSTFHATYAHIYDMTA